MRAILDPENVEHLSLDGLLEAIVGLREQAKSLRISLDWYTSQDGAKAPDYERRGGEGVMDENSRTFENTWAIVELMGHQVIAGQVTEVTVAGAPMLRVDVPEIAGAEQRLAFTKFFAPGALYGLTPTDEASARHAVEHLRARPISPYTIPERVRALPAPLFDVAAGDPDGEEVDP